MLPPSKSQGIRDIHHYTIVTGEFMARVFKLLNFHCEVDKTYRFCFLTPDQKESNSIWLIEASLFIFYSQTHTYAYKHTHTQIHAILEQVGA